MQLAQALSLLVRMYVLFDHTNAELVGEEQAKYHVRAWSREFAESGIKDEL